MADLPVEPIDCRRKAEQNLPGWQPPTGQETGVWQFAGDMQVAVAWALLAVAGELAEIRRELKRRK